MDPTETCNSHHPSQQLVYQKQATIKFKIQKPKFKIQLTEYSISRVWLNYNNTFLCSAITPSMKDTTPKNETKRAICFMVTAMANHCERENGKKKLSEEFWRIKSNDESDDNLGAENWNWIDDCVINIRNHRWNLYSDNSAYRKISVNKLILKQQETY